ncbi:type II secretion system F family protein [Phaeospirillum tilakii]|uniref:Type II secretion system F family protein n=1 Tax=Phaeospirillum tilakii TaxID=741673 RepID=A0ABW5CDR5_9PROT
MSALSPEDVITLAGFCAVPAGWALVATLRAAYRDSPRMVMRRRALEVAHRSRRSESALAAGDDDLLLRPLRGGDGLREQAARWRRRVIDLGGRRGWHLLLAAEAILAVTTPIAAALLGLPALLALALLPAQAVLVAVGMQRVLRARFRRRFLDGFPGVLDLIVRAVRAGVPVNAAIQTAGEDLPEPIGPEYRRMSDALRLGVDQGEVFAAASRRIGLAEFRFFAICLEVQRETGGPLSETLENLAAIIRARAEVRLKTRALTAEGRSAAKIIATIPLVITAGLYFAAQDYLGPFLESDAGHHLLAVAAIMVGLGLGLIFQMTRLEA